MKKRNESDDKLRRYTILLHDSLIKIIDKKLKQKRIGLSPYLRQIIIEHEENKKGK